jgi:hypothetical protein
MFEGMNHMLKKTIAGAIAAGALTIPLAGVSWADKPSDPGGNGNHGANSNAGGNAPGTNQGDRGNHGDGNNAGGNGVGNGPNRGGNGGPVTTWSPGDPPGHNPFGPPGQIKNSPTVGDDFTNPFEGVPPGHWDDQTLTGLPATFTPPGTTTALPVVWNPDANAFGVFTDDGQFIIVSPAPTP